MTILLKRKISNLKKNINKFIKNILQIRKIVHNKKMKKKYQFNSIKKRTTYLK